jgi:hypothetical protein
MLYLSIQRKITKNNKTETQPPRALLPKKYTPQAILGKTPHTQLTGLIIKPLPQIPLRIYFRRFEKSLH